MDAVAPGTIDIDALRKIREEAQTSTDLSETEQKNILNLLDRAIALSQSESQLRKQIEYIKLQLEQTPARIKVIKTELNRPMPSPDYVATTASNMKSDQRENQLRKLAAELTEAKTIVNKFTDQLNAVKDRPAGLQQDIITAKQRLQELIEKLKATPPPMTPSC